MTRAELACVGFAVALHAVGLLVAREVPPTVFVSSVERRPLELVEIDMPDLPPEPAERLTPTEPLAAGLDRREEAAPRPVDLERAPRAERIVPGPSDPPGEPGPVEGPVVTAPQPSGTTDPNQWSVPDAGAWLPPGVGPQAPVWAQPGVLSPSALAAAPAATAAPRAPRAERDVANKLLGDDLRERDKKLGLQLPAAGSVASIVKGAVYAADVPSNARAAIQVTLGPGGKVTGVRVLSNSGGDAATWNAIAQSVKASLGGARLSLTGEWEKGATIVVNVQSKMQLPSGSAGDGGIDLSTTQSFDVGDIGAKARRVVYTSFSASPLK